MKLFWPVLFLSLMLCSHLSAEEPIKLDIKTSPTHGLYYMLECLMGQPHRSQIMGSVLKSRVGNWFPVEQGVELWKESLAGDELSTLAFPRVQNKSVSLDAVMEKTALQADSAEDLVHRVSPWLGPAHSEALSQALTTLEPLYRRYYWSEASPLLAQRRTELLEHLKEGEFEINFRRAAGFFHSQLPPGERPVLALIPLIPPLGQKKVHTRGHNSGTLQVMEVRVDRPLTDEAGVVFHEFAHALWWGQDLEERERWKSAFTSHGLVGRLAYAQLNEGLATALGNGWFHQRVSGALDEGEWYADPVIDAYGKALLGVVREPLEAGRPPNDGELNDMVEAFQRALPGAVKNFDVVASDFLTVSSLSDVHRSGFQDELMRLGPVRWSRVRGWEEQEKAASSTFRLYWLEPGQRGRLQDMGWSEQDTRDWTSYRLRQTQFGWELAFEGSASELFDVLRGFQKNGLVQGQE